MIGPIPMDDPFNDPFPTGNANAALIWQERQRRQRTVRLMMMFLMMLLLMDGEEPNRRRHSDPNYHLRHRHKKGDGKLPKIDDNVYVARLFQDEKVQGAALLHPRYGKILELNEGKDVEGEIRDWVKSDIEAEKGKDAAATKLEDDERESARNRKGGGKDKSPATEADEEEVKRKVHHYPHNSTGYYRGEWKLFKARGGDDDSEDGDPDKSEDNVEEDDAPSRGGSKRKEGMDDEAEERSSKEQVVVDEFEIEAKMKDLLREQGERIGVYLLPPGHILAAAEEEKNSTASAKTKKTKMKDGDEFSEKPYPYMRPRRAESSKDDDPPKVSLSQSSGRAAFQLYARPVPAMTQLSLIDGFVKLYDGKNTAFSSRRDVLLRVRGIVIHAIGKISLVANADSGRSALVIRSDGDDTDGGTDEDARRDERRRRLQGAVSDFVVAASSDERNSTDEGRGPFFDGLEKGLLEQIRDDAISLFADTESLGQKKYLWHGHSVRGEEDESQEGWLLDTFDDTNSFDDLFHGERSRQRAEFLSNHFDTASTTVEETGAEASTSWWSSSFRSTRRSLRVFNGEEEDVGSKVSESEELGDVMGDSDESERASFNKTASLKALSEKEVSKRRAKANTVTKEKKSAAQKEADAAALEKMTKDIQAFPYAPDDKDHTLRKAVTPASRKIPYREQVLEENAAQCEFQLSFDIKETEWTIGEWRKMMGRQAREVKDLDPALRTDEDDDEDDDDRPRPPTRKKKRPSTTTRTKASSSKPRKSEKDEALVMALTGSIVSPNCDFSSSINVTAIRTDWEHTTGKAINYSFYMMLTCLTQIVVLLRQLLHTQAQSAATRVSLVCIGWQTVLDAILCIGHIFLCLVMQPLFTAFASVAFFKLLIFCVIEMKYMAIIIQARNNANNTNNNAEDLRRQVALLHLRFYSCLMLAIMLFWYMGQKHRTAYVLVLYSFWVPQIIQNIITEAKKPLHHYYIYGMSVTRLVAPLYIFAVPNNFLKEVNPEFPTNFVMCELLILWVGIQTAILIGQGKYGTRFMIPARFLPPKFDYSRPIPSSLLPPPTAGESPGRIESDTSIETVPLTTDGAADNTTGVARNRMKGNRSRVSSRDNGTTRVEEPTNGGGNGPTLDCVICYNGIDINNRRGYMLAPCDHIFHRDCLVQWMDVKMECPICRTELPAL